MAALGDCRQCVFWKKRKFIDGEGKPMDMPDLEKYGGVGVCRRYPPTPGRHSNDPADRPNTWGEDQCGEYKFTGE